MGYLYFTLLEKKKLKLLLFIVALFLMSIETAVGHDILILNSYHPGKKLSDDMVAAIAEGLHENLSEITIAIEHIDSKNYSTDTVFPLIKNALQIKYSQKIPDIIFTVDNNALTLALDLRTTLFVNVPIVFCGVNDFKNSLLQGYRGITGVAEAADIPGTVDLITRLYPTLTHLATVTDVNPTGLILREEFKRDVISKDLLSEIKHVDCHGMNESELKACLLNLPGSSAILHLTWYRDDEGNNYSLNDQIEITTNMSLPVFHCWDQGIGDGFAGGLVVSGTEQGRQAVKLGLKILAGASPDEIPVLTESPNVPVFDERVLLQTKADLSSLPPDAVIRFRYISFYEQYYRIILGIIVVIAILMLITAVLWVNLVKRIRAERRARLSEKNLKQAEHELKQQLAFTQSLLTSIPTPVFFKDADGKYIACNQDFSNFVGLSSDLIIGKTAFDIWPSDYAEKYHQLDMRLISDQKKQSIDYKILGADGLQHDVILSNDVFFDDKGNVSVFVGSFLDISERLQAERAVHESELKYRQLVENATDAIFIAQDETIKFSNNKTLELTGYTIDELEDIPFMKLIHPDDQAIVAERYVRRLKGDEDIPDTYSFRIITRNSEEYTVLLSSVLVEWKGRPATLCFARDITEQKVLEASFFQAQKMEAIGTLASGIAHDFNNLLMAILGRVTLISADLNSSHPHYANFQGIEESIKSATTLTGQLLGIARGGKYEARPIDINELVSSSSSLFGRTKKDMYIRTATHPSPVVVSADKQQIEQVLLNLYVNASHAMPDGGELFLQTSTVSLGEEICKSHQIVPGKYAQILITDTGIGMDQKTLEKIFDPFFTTKEIGRGTGLGLSSAFGIIKNHNGMISVRSEINHGSSFNIYLPLSKEEVVHDDIVKKDLHVGTETVLLVDDETVVLEVGHEMLKSLGYQVVLATGGEQALKILSEEGGNIDLVIMDMIMPGMDGETLFFRIKEQYSQMPILLSSGYSLNEQAEVIMQGGCNGFIQKPFGLSDFSQKIRLVLDEE